MTIQPTPAVNASDSATEYFFNARELARLAVYRAAVSARFYTDQCEPIADFAEYPSTRLLESVGEGW